MLGDVLACYTQFRVFGLQLALSEFGEPLPPPVWWTCFRSRSNSRMLTPPGSGLAGLVDLLAALAFPHENLLLSDIHASSLRVIVESLSGPYVQADMAPFQHMEMNHLNWPEVCICHPGGADCQVGIPIASR